MKGQRWTLGLTLAAIVIGTIAFYRSASFSARSGEDNPIYSSTRYDPYGTAALQELLARRGVRVRNLERPSLDAGDHGVLIEVLPDESSSLGSEGLHLKSSELAEWMAEGNTVIQLAREETDLMKRLGIKVDKAPELKQLQQLHEFEEKGKPPDDAPGSVATARLSLPGHAVRADDSDGPEISLRIPMTFADKQNAAWRPIAWVESDAREVVAGEYRVGKGKLVVVGSTTPALNQSLGDVANLDFLLTEIGNGPVIFDEWSHGIGRQATVMGFLRDVGLLPVLIQLVFVMILYVWSTSGLQGNEEAPAPGSDRASSKFRHLAISTAAH